MSDFKPRPSREQVLKLTRQVVEGTGLSTNEKLEAVTEAFKYMDDVEQLQFQIVLDVWKDHGSTGMQVATEIFEELDLQDADDFDPEMFLNLLEQRLQVRNSVPIELHHVPN